MLLIFLHFFLLIGRDFCYSLTVTDHRDEYLAIDLIRHGDSTLPLERTGDVC